MDLECRGHDVRVALPVRDELGDLTHAIPPAGVLVAGSEDGTVGASYLSTRRHEPQSEESDGSDKGVEAARQAPGRTSDEKRRLSLGSIAFLDRLRASEDPRTRSFPLDPRSTRARTRPREDPARATLQDTSIIEGSTVLG